MRFCSRSNFLEQYYPHVFSLVTFCALVQAGKDLDGDGDVGVIGGESPRKIDILEEGWLVRDVSVDP